MSEIPSLVHWDRIIADLEAKLSKARMVRELLADPELNAELATSFGISKAARRDRNANRIAAPSNGHSLTQIDIIGGFFDHRDNEWATIAEIVEATGLPKDAVRNKIYMVYPDQFERRDAVGGGRQKEFRINVRGEKQEKE